jgi:hypothetical protein
MTGEDKIRRRIQPGAILLPLTHADNRRLRLANS